MSIYNSSYSGAKDNERTKRAKAKLQRILTEQFAKRGFKSWIKTEVPATFTDPKPICYHLDLGVLFRSKTEFDLYHFIAIEIDDSSHFTINHERKDLQRDESFFSDKGILTCRIPIDKIFEERGDEEQMFDKRIWQPILSTYIMTPFDNRQSDLQNEINKTFAIQLKENAQTQCKNCDHKAVHHDLTGCSYRLTNKSKLKCNCHTPFFRSDE